MTTRIVLVFQSELLAATALHLVSRKLEALEPELKLVDLNIDTRAIDNPYAGTLIGANPNRALAGTNHAIGVAEQQQQTEDPAPAPAATRGRRAKTEAAPTPPAAGEPATSPSPAPAASAPAASAETAATPAPADKQEAPAGNSAGAAQAATQSSTAPETGAPSATGSVLTVAAMRLLMDPKVRGGKRVDVSKAIVSACAEASKLLGSTVPNSLDRLYGDLATLPADRKAEGDAIISALATTVEAL